MKSAPPLVLVLLINLLLVSFTPASCRPQQTFTTNTFSNFDPSSQTFTAGTSTNLHQESFSGNADDFLLSFEKLFPQTGVDPSFNIFATNGNGECDEFCQNVVALDAQSQARFEQDLTDFQAQFGNSLSVGGGGVPPVKPQTSRPRIQTQSSSLF